MPFENKPEQVPDAVTRRYPFEQVEHWVVDEQVAQFEVHTAHAPAVLT